MNNNLENPIVKILIAIIGALALIIVALIGYNATVKTELLPIEATQTAEALHTQIAMITQSYYALPTDTPFSITNSPTLDVIPTSTSVPNASQTLPTLIPGLLCTDNLISKSWHLEATADADEDWIDFSDRYTLQGKDVLRVTYDLHGLMAQEGTGKNNSAIVFNQPNWYGVSLVNYGTNGLNGEQTVDIPISAFLELPDPGQNIVGGRQLDLTEPVSSIRARFWHQDHFTVDITAIYLCTLP